MLPQNHAPPHKRIKLATSLKKRPKVLHIMRSYGRHGGENQLARLFALGAQSQFDEHFVQVFKDDKFLALLKTSCPDLTIHQLLKTNLQPKNQWFELVQVLALSPILLFRFLYIFLKVSPLVVFSHGMQAALVTWPFAVAFKNTSWNYMHRTTKTHTKFDFLFRFLYFPFKTLIGNSNSVARSLERYRTRDNEVEVLFNGVEIYENSKGSSSTYFENIFLSKNPKLITVGRLMPHKRQEFLIDVVYQLVNCRALKVEFLIVGDGPSKRALEDKVVKLGLSDYIHFIGYFDHPRALLRKSSVFLYASEREGMSNAVLEAMAEGLPSVVIDAPGVSDCHKNLETGFVVDRELNSFVNAVATLLSNQDIRLKLGQNALKHVQTEFSNEKNRQRFNDFYNKKIQGKY